MDRLLEKIEHKDLEDIDVIRSGLDGDSRLRKKFEVLREDMKDATNGRKSGNAATLRYMINKAYDALESEENLYEDIKKTKSRHVP